MSGCRGYVRDWHGLQILDRGPHTVVSSEHWLCQLKHLTVHSLKSRKPWLKAFLVSLMSSVFHSLYSKYPHCSVSSSDPKRMTGRAYSSKLSVPLDSQHESYRGTPRALTFLIKDLGQTINAVGQCFGLSGSVDDLTVRFRRS